MGRDGEGEPPKGSFSSLIEEIIRGASGQGTSPAFPELRSGDVFGRYELRREIGRGGFGVVWEARDRDLGRTVAFKVLRNPGEERRERRLLAEAEVAARLSHPNIVTVLDVGRTPHGVFLVQEYLVGQPLTMVLEKERLPLGEALRIGGEIARALTHAHANGVVHRDLSASNIFVCDDGQVKLLDLGMAAALGRPTLRGGTRDAMAPEQAAGAPEDERTDIFALGALLFRMVSGAHPLAQDRAGRPRGSARALEVPEVPALGLLVESMLAENPLDRPRDAGAVLSTLQAMLRALRDAGAVLSTLQAMLRALPGQVLNAASLARVRAPRRVRWLLAGMAAGLGVAAAAGVSFALWSPRFSPLNRGSLVLSAVNDSSSCDWRLLTHFDFDAIPSAAQWRNGKYGAQAEAKHEMRDVWLQTSDWNQLFIPLGDARPETFAIDAEFWMPPIDRARSASLYAFTDRVGPLDSTSSNVVHGRGLLLAEKPGAAPYLEWGIPDGMTTHAVVHQGTFGGGTLGNQWHTLRIEGSRARCWLRASIDARPVLTEYGHCDFAGSNVLLAAGSDSYASAEIAWREVHVFAGAPGCE
jgi:serine/threonine protein kinase